MSQRSPRRSSLLAAPAALLLVLAACGDDDTTGDDDTEITTAATEPTDTEPARTEAAGTEPAGTAAPGATYEVDDYVGALVEEIGGDDEGSECVARAVIEAIGTERLEASGVAPDELARAGDLADVDLRVDAANAPALQADLEACPDLVELFGQAADVSEEEIECVRENVTQAQLAELLVVQFTGGTPSQELLDAQAATQACSQE